MQRTENVRGEDLRVGDILRHPFKSDIRWTVKSVAQGVWSDGQTPPHQKLMWRVEIEVVRECRRAVEEQQQTLEVFVGLPPYKQFEREVR